MLQSSVEGARAAENRVGVGVAARLSRYLQVLTQAKKMGRTASPRRRSPTTRTSTRRRSAATSRTSASSASAASATRSTALVSEIRKILRTQGQHNIALVGAGRLGQAIAGSPIFAEHGITIAAVFDTDVRKLGTPIGGVESTDYRRLKDVIRDEEHRRRRARRARRRRPSRRPTTSSTRACGSSSTTPRRCSTSPAT